jgi:hypothetical protein
VSTLVASGEVGNRLDAAIVVAAEVEEADGSVDVGAALPPPQAVTLRIAIDHSVIARRLIIS